MIHASGALVDVSGQEQRLHHLMDRPIRVYTLDSGASVESYRIDFGYPSDGEVGPVIVDGRVLFIAAAEDNKGFDVPNGILFAYRQKGVVDHICYFDR